MGMPQHSPQPTLAGWSAVNSTTPSRPGKTVNCGSEESSEISKQKVPGRVERPVPGQVWTALRSPAVAGPSQGGGAFRVLIQNDDKRQTTDDYDKHW